MSKQIIDRFAGKHFFLSNFYNATVHYGGHTYRNNEAAFQAQKCPERATEFEELDPSEAKKLGRKVSLRPDWESVKVRVMYEVCLDKFTTNPDLRTKLLGTGDARLVEGNTWGDTYWGMYHGRGSNMLGNILMIIRDELRVERRLDDTVVVWPPFFSP